MTLVNQFQVTLKDFWPDHPDRMFVTDRDRGTTTTISRRLYAELKAYAQENQLPYDSVVQQLHDEIHAETIAGNIPTTTPQFSKFDRVKLSATTIETLRHSPGSPVSSPWWRMRTNRSGTVAHNSNGENDIAVVWDGAKTAQYISKQLLERTND
jgi:hypothetical protein